MALTWMKTLELGAAVRQGVVAKHDDIYKSASEYQMPYRQGFNMSDMLSFDPASMGLNAPNAEVQSPQQPITITNQLQNIKDLLCSNYYSSW